MTAHKASTLSPPLQGVGVGLRSCHYDFILNESPAVPWFEILTDNYLTPGGPAKTQLFRIRENYPMAMHCVGMSLGASDPLNWPYLKKIKSLADVLEPSLISDHLCWISHDKRYLHELLPLPYTDEAVHHVAQRIKVIQDFLERPIAIENVSSYLTYTTSHMPEWDFLNAVAKAADCLILLDINNIFVSATNHGFSPETYLNEIDKSPVVQCHLAGFTDCGDYLLDSHGEAVHEPVWALYEKALKRLGPVPTLIEWDNNIPDFSVLAKERQKAENMMQSLENVHEIK